MARQDFTSRDIAALVATVALVLFKQFVDDDLGCASYLIGDEHARAALVVDPAYAIDQYLDECRRRGVELQGELAEVRVLPDETAVAPLEVDARLLQVALPPYSERLKEENSLPVMPELKFPHSATFGPTGRGTRSAQAELSESEVHAK